MQTYEMDYVKICRLKIAWMPDALEWGYILRQKELFVNCFLSF